MGWGDGRLNRSLQQVPRALRHNYWGHLCLSLPSRGPSSPGQAEAEMQGQGQEGLRHCGELTQEVWSLPRLQFSCPRSHVNLGR